MRKKELFTDFAIWTFIVTGVYCTTYLFAHLRPLRGYFVLALVVLAALLTGIGFGIAE